MYTDTAMDGCQMIEREVSRILAEESVNYVVSLPCDRTKNLCSVLQEDFTYITVNREEDGVGLCAGLALSGQRAVLQMQSSGLGNSLNALLTLTALYHLPLPILASWRGVYQEKIPAQIPFNQKIPDILQATGISCTIVADGSPEQIRNAVVQSFERSEIHVILISPQFWEQSTDSGSDPAFPSRARQVSLAYHREIVEPEMIRGEAIRVVAQELTGELVVANIGVPSKELYAVRDRPENFYMLGSYTQATPIGLGLALGQERDVIVLDGDGSLLGTAILPTVASESPSNLTIVALDNGAFGSTGGQMTAAWNRSDLELLAIGAGLTRTRKVRNETELKVALHEKGEGPSFIHVLLKPGNTKVSDIPFPAQKIASRFMEIIR